ncbi:hypothetical protein D3C86_1694150 [compost metagenome]
MHLESCIRAEVSGDVWVGSVTIIVERPIKALGEPCAGERVRERNKPGARRNAVVAPKLPPF